MRKSAVRRSFGSANANSPQGVVVAEELAAAPLEDVLGLLASGDVGRDPEDRVGASVGGDDGDLDRLEPARAAFGRGHRLLLDELRPERVHDLEIVGAKVLDLGPVGVEIRVGFPDELRRRDAVDRRDRAIGEGEPPVAILGEDEIRIEIEHLPEKRALGELLEGLAALLADIPDDGVHHAALAGKEADLDVARRRFGRQGEVDRRGRGPAAQRTNGLQ